MRERPRTWPSMRCRRLRTEALAFVCMAAIYPPRVSIARKPAANRMTDATHQHAGHGHHDHAHGKSAADTVIDPVCGMTVDPHTTPHRHTHQGRPYYFCSAGCRTKFAADPAKYLSPGARATEPVPAGAIYTCPMHPEIRQAGPGACPICGM